MSSFHKIPFPLLLSFELIVSLAIAEASTICFPSIKGICDAEITIPLTCLTGLPTPWPKACDAPFRS